MNGVESTSNPFPAERKRRISSDGDSDEEDLHPSKKSRPEDSSEKSNNEPQPSGSVPSEQPKVPAQESRPAPELNVGSEEGDDDDEEEDEAVIAGYEFCQQEAIRFLLEEEKLDESHPLVQQLRQHLRAQRQALDSKRVLDEFIEREDVL